MYPRAVLQKLMSAIGKLIRIDICFRKTYRVLGIANEKAGGALGTWDGRRWRARSVLVLLMIGNIDDVNDRTMYDRSSRNM